VHEFAPRVRCPTIFARAVKVRPAGRVGSTIRGGAAAIQRQRWPCDSPSLAAVPPSRRSPRSFTARRSFTADLKNHALSTMATALRIFAAAHVEPV
jgi:hypothetical protein